MPDLPALLAILEASDWTISWAYQYGHEEWRMCLIRRVDVGAEQGTYVVHVAFAPSFAEALEECLELRDRAEFEADRPQGYEVIDDRPNNILQQIVKSITTAPVPPPVRR